MGIIYGYKQEPKKEESASDKIFDAILDFKMQSKELLKAEKKSEKAKDAAIKKLQDAISNNKPVAAKTYAEDAIRQKNQAVKYEVLAYKLVAVQNKLQAAYQNQKLSENMSKMVNSMNGALSSMDLVKISENMSQFEEIFENIDANAEVMDKAMDNIDSNSFQDKDVNNLIMLVAKQNNYKLEKEFDDIQNYHDPKIVEKNIQKELNRN